MDLEDLLQSCGLNHTFLGHIQRQDIFSVFFGNNESKQSFSTRLHESTFIRKIVYFNGNCRKVRTRTGIRCPHPLDISTAVFLCCNFIARQDLVLHFWGCKHAFPLVIKTEQLEAPVIYIWPMKNLIAKCYAPDGGDTVQKPVLDFKMKVVSAFRFGEQTVSKSNILNMIISKSGKEHSFFFHRDLEGTVKQLSDICDGMIESCPVFDTEDSPSLYLNLRGNCKNHPDQLHFVLTASDIIILVCNKDEVDKFKSLVENETSIHKKLLIIFVTDLTSREEDIPIAEELEDFCNLRSIANLIVALKGVMRFDWLTDVLSAIKCNTCVHSIEDLMKIAEDNYFDIDIDRLKQPIGKAKLFSNAVIQLYKEQQISCIFPVQGPESLEWSKADREIYMLQNWKTIEHVRTYRDTLEKQKQLLRLKQLNLIKSGKIYLTYVFLENIESGSVEDGGLSTEFTGSLINAEEQNEIYLRSLKLELENATRSHLNQLYKTYTALLSKLSVDELHSAEIQHELDELDLSIANNSVSISEFSREMGQIYETVASQCVNEERLILDRLSCVAVKLLLYGHQIEIMDGRSNSVPINWVKGILSELKRTLGNIRVKIISVLGVQSTGKSTLLNIMFGSQFAEGSGRCTRGAFIHLVKVLPECSEQFRVDYVLVVDTEGLFSLSSVLEESEKRDRKDRELATFVIGISNITVVNIMGENLSYLKDILPVSVHAFLRMDLAGLNPNCVFLHQNVARGNKDHLLQQTYHLENVLDEFTLAACKLENVGPKRFKDIIHFDIVKNVYYFPPLFESSDAQEIINPHFSEAVENLKMDLMAKTDGTATIADLAQHIGHIWEAVKRDNFVFELKNTIEAKARAVIDREICYIQWELRSKFHENITTFISLINVCTDLDTLMQTQSEYYDNTLALTTVLTEKSCSDIFSKIPSTIIGKSISKFQNLIKDSMERSIEEDRKMFANQFETEVKKRKKEIAIIKGDERTLREIDNFLVTNLKKEMTASSDVNELSDVLFRKWIRVTQFEDDNVCNFIPDEDATSCIYLAFPTRHANINERLEEKCITDRNMADFLNGVPPTYWSSDDRHSEERMANEIVTDLMQFLQGVLENLQSGKINYGVGIFKDIVLHVRNHHFINKGLIHTKPVFEIDLALSLCGEFIQRINKLDQKHVSIDRPLKKHAEQYFRSRVRETLSCQTDVSEAVNNFSSIILTELSNFVVSGLSQEFATYMKNQYSFLSSKQALITHLYMTLIESHDLPFLFICLHSFEHSVRCCISRLFDSISGIETDTRIGPLRIVVEEHFERQIAFICKRLTENITPHNITQSPTMKQCVNIITSALDPFLQMNSIKPFETDIIEETEPGVVITMLVANLKKESVRTKLLKTIKYLVIETEEYDKIKIETVQIISSMLIGCTENCPLCGEVCCIGQVNHSGKHRSLMHRPTGMNGNCTESSKRLSSLTCWEELNTTDHNATQAIAVKPIREKWFIPSDISIDDNSSWKYIFVTYIKEIANRWSKDEPIDIPRSWYDLTHIAEMRKLSSN